MSMRRESNRGNVLVEVVVGIVLLGTAATILTAAYQSSALAIDSGARLEAARLAVMTQAEFRKQMYSENGEYDLPSYPAHWAAVVETQAVVTGFQRLKVAFSKDGKVVTTYEICKSSQ